MDSTHRPKLIKRRGVAKASLTRMQNFLESGDLKVNEIKVRFDELPGIFNTRAIQKVTYVLAWRGGGRC